MNRFQTALLIGALALAVLPGRAQTPEIQQMKQRIQQLEQMVEELKNQIAAVEKNQTVKGKPAAAVASPAASQPQQVPIAQLPTTYIGRETQMRQTAAENDVSAPRIDNESIDPELRGFFRVPATKTLIKLGGFVKTDFFYDLNYAGSYYGAFVPSSFPDSPQPKSADSTMSMRPSRFSVEFRQPTHTGGGDNDVVKGYLEFDFLGNYDRTSLRMRQFYGQYKNFLAGQTWSLFGDPDAFPDTLEFEGPPGIIAMRDPQFRWTQPLDHHNSLAVSVEKSGTDTPFATQFGSPIGTSTRPDFVASYRYENNLGHIQLSSLFRSVGGLIPNTTVPNLENHVVGYGGSLSGVWRLGKLRDNVVFQLVLGKGISNYYNDNFGLGTDVGFDASGHLVATPTGSGQAGYQHYWTKKVRSTVSYGYTRINSPAGDPGTTYHVSNYATGNIIIQPSVSLLFGAEYVYGSLERKDGFKWIAPRVQASVTYYLNKHPID